MGLIVDILTVKGSPQFVSEKTIYGDGIQIGVGGSELFLLTMCRAWTEAGHKVTLYNNPRELGASCFKQAHEDEFDPNEDRDILIYFRGPNFRGLNAKGKKIWISCDQATVGDYLALSREVSEIVTISQFHADYFKKIYGIENTHVIDIPVREWDYNPSVEKNPLQVLFCSVPERGLKELAPIWDLITREVPEAQLYITGDHRLWDANVPVSSTMQYRMLFAQFPNVHYMSAIGRDGLVKLQLQSVIHLFPNVYPELFCISNAECQYAGAFPITSNVGALATTNMGYVATNHPQTTEGQRELANTTINYLTHQPTLKYAQENVRTLAYSRFSIEEAVARFDEVFNG